ncbi:MAG: histidinol dehydrogenase [Calditrichia bacterium]
MRIIRSVDLPNGFFIYRELEDVASVKEIIDDVRLRGDQAIVDYTMQFDGVTLETLRYPKDKIAAAYESVDQATQDAIRTSIANLETFATRQMEPFKDFEMDVQPGVTAGQRVQPLERVAVYVPGGGFPLISSLLMGAVPARIAGVEQICVCSPPTANGTVHPAIVVAADILGIDEIYAMGGAHAIAALAYGTDSVKRVDKIVGPGNKYVAQAKKEVFGVVGIDMIAGPTEVLIIADETARPEVVASDLIAQAEHDRDASPILVTTSEKLAQSVVHHIKLQLLSLGTADIAYESMARNGAIILVPDMIEAIDISNRRAPEHLEIQVQNPDMIVSHLTNYGSLFIGELTAEVLGDYSSGINHTLPTNTTARYRAGLSVLDFIKLQTTLSVNEEGLKHIGDAAKTLASAEGLQGHRKSVEMRHKILLAKKV